jgi:hypothetical protein
MKYSFLVICFAFLVFGVMAQETTPEATETTTPETPITPPLQK